MELFLSVYDCLEQVENPFAIFKSKVILLKRMWNISLVPVKPCWFKLYPVSHGTEKWPGGFLPMPVSLLGFFVFTYSLFKFLFDSLAFFVLFSYSLLKDFFALCVLFYCFLMPTRMLLPLFLKLI